MSVAESSAVARNMETNHRKRRHYSEESNESSYFAHNSFSTHAAHDLCDPYFPACENQPFLTQELSFLQPSFPNDSYPGFPQFDASSSDWSDFPDPKRTRYSSSAEMGASLAEKSPSSDNDSGFHEQNNQGFLDSWAAVDGFMGPNDPSFGIPAGDELLPNQEGFFSNPFDSCFPNFCLPESSTYNYPSETDPLRADLLAYEGKNTDSTFSYSSTLAVPYPQGQETSYNPINGVDNVAPHTTDFGCDTAPFTEQPWVFSPPQSTHSNQPLVNKQSMVYAPRPTDAEWKQPPALNDGFPDIYSQLALSNPAAAHDLNTNTNNWFSNNAAALDFECSNSGGCEPTRRGPFKSKHDREQTAQTRRDGSCVRCRAQKIRCVPDPTNRTGICLTCKNVKAVGIKLYKTLCVRCKITDVRLYKNGQVPGFEWTLRWSNRKLKDLTTWESDETTVIQASEGYTPTPVKLVVRRFKVIRGDKTVRKWVTPNGVEKSVAIPAYAIVDLVAAENAYKDYINTGGAQFVYGALDRTNELLVMTYDMAINSANHKDVPEEDRLLLKKALRLWVAIRLNTRATSIVGRETLGMRRDILDATHPNHGKIPIPPVMGNQIELILTRIQNQLRTEVLDALQKLIYTHKCTSWLTIYLCSFILLHNCSLITKHDAYYARKHGMQTHFARPAMVAEYHEGANYILAHFHYCNKNSAPFAPHEEKESEVIRLAELNEEQMVFVRKTRALLNQEGNAERFETLRKQRALEDDWYFVAQMFEEDWQPRDMH